MPRHLMVRRTNNTERRSIKTSNARYRTNCLDPGVNMIFDRNAYTFNEASTSLLLDSSPRSVNVSTEMTWRGSSLNTPAISDDEYVHDLTNRTTDDKENAQNVTGYHFEQTLKSRLGNDNIVPQTGYQKLSEIASWSKDKYALASQVGDESKSSSTPEERRTGSSSRTVYQGPKKLAEDNTSPYLLFGVKKNFLQRSGSLGYLRLHSLSPSKSRQTHSTLKRSDDSSLSPTHISKHNPHQYSRPKFVPISEHDASLKLTSDCLAPSSVEHASPTECHAARKQPYFNIKRMGPPSKLCYSTLPDQDDFNDTINESNDIYNLAINDFRGITQTDKLTSNRVPPEVTSSIRLSHEECDLQTEQNELPGECINLLSMTKVAKDSIAAFFHDNKENNPPSLKSKKEHGLLHHKSAYTKVPSPEVVSSGESFMIDNPDEREQLADVKILEADVCSNHRWHVDEGCENTTDKGQSETMDGTYKGRSFSSETTHNHSVMQLSEPSSSLSLHVATMHSVGEGQGRVTTPPIDQEINNPDELPASVEIDVVGDLPPTHTSCSSGDSGVVSDMSSSVNDTAHKQNDKSVKDELVAHDLSNHRARTSRPGGSPDASFARASGYSYATPERLYSTKPMFSSTPVSHVWSPWMQPQPQPQMNLVHYPQPAMYPYISSLAAPYAVVHPPPILSQHLNSVVSRGPQYRGFDGTDHKYPNMMAQVDPALRGSPQYPTCFSSSLHLDLPLNLTNRRPTQIPTPESKTSHRSAYASFDSSSRSIFSGDMNKTLLAGTSGNNMATQHPYGVFDNRSLSGPNYGLPVLCVPQEHPLNMSLAGKRQNTADSEVTDGPNECKKRRVSRKSKKCDMALQVIKTAAVQNIENVKVEVESSCPNTTEQVVKGVTLGSPPSGARPISFLVKTKERMDGTEPKMAKTVKKCKENVFDGESETAKQRNKPELFGEKDISDLIVKFFDCPERSRFCDGDLKFQVPKIPDSVENQSELRLALLRLFSSSNLPPVPSALQHSVHALSQYPFMQHIFSLHSQGVNLDMLKFGAYGLAFENIRLVDLGDQKFNDILDRMSYLGDDGLLHCLVKNEKTGTLCGHVAHEIGKIRRHSKNHYPDKKWVCVFCRVQMCDMTDLERHTATHTELKPFECPQCSKKFCQKVTLTQHMHKGHGKELTKWDAKSSYICRQDGCSFSQGDEMACVRHLKQHHSQSDYIKRKNQNKWPFNCLSENVVKIVDEET